MYRDLENRVAQINQQLAAARAEQEQRASENEALVSTRQQLAEARETAQREATEAHQQIATLRSEMTAMEHDLKVLRSGD